MLSVAVRGRLDVTRPKSGERTASTPGDAEECVEGVIVELGPCMGWHREEMQRGRSKSENADSNRQPGMSTMRGCGD